MTMRLFPRSSRRLGWKLTASYTLVTVTTLVVLHLVFLGVGVGILLWVGNQMPKDAVDQLLWQVAPDARPYLNGETPDLEGIHGWLGDVSRSDVTTVRGEQTGIRLEIVDLGDERTRLLLLDTEGRVLGDSRRESPVSTPQPLDTSLAPGIGDVLPRALRGSIDSGALYHLTGTEWLTFAVPVREGGQVIGVLVLTGRVTPVAFALGVGSVTLVAVSVFGMILFTLVAGLFGTVLGFFNARGLTRRLDRVTAAAAAWGEGDFTPTIDDRSPDELGQLGRHLNRMAVQLEDLLQTQQQLSAAEERNRLARDLHDSVKQQVFAIGMNLAAARARWAENPEAARERLEAAAELVRLSQQELTSIIQTLRPVELEGKGLCRALAEHVERWQGQTGIHAGFVARGSGALPFPVEEALFRIAQEALSNIARHSDASTARVTVTVGDGGAALAVEDNGRGFDAGDQKQGVGLRSMRERAEALGGELRVESGATGTAVVARVPIGGIAEHERDRDRAARG
jgi:two-component system, NarL family, sensor histidine kinase LiaS